MEEEEELGDPDISTDAGKGEEEREEGEGEEASPLPSKSIVEVFAAVRLEGVVAVAEVAGTGAGFVRDFSATSQINDLK
jgi:hypothetical protein